MDWENRNPYKGETCIKIADSQEPYVTQDTMDIDEALAAFCETYDTNGCDADIELSCHVYQDGEEVDGYRVQVRMNPDGGLEMID